MKSKIQNTKSGSRTQTTGEELANSITHAIGAGLSLAGMAVLIVLSAKCGDPWRVVSFSIYGTTLFFLYLASTLYHSFRSQHIKQIFRIFDHASIYLLIAGTYTPITLISLRGPWGWTLFGIIWGLAIGGIIAKIFLMDKYKIISVLLYLIMGWLVVIAIKPLAASVPKEMMMWLFIGGICYTVGLAFYAVKKVPYFHFVWHLFVLGGSITHFFGIFFHLTAA